MKKKRNILFVPFLILCLFFAVSCEKEEINKDINDKKSSGKYLPTLITDNVLSITTTSAKSGGRIISDGGTSVISRGVVWSIGEEPTTEDNKTTDSGGSEVFMSEISGLKSATKYYVRAYATNEIGTTYGNTQTFTTLATLEDIDLFVDSRDGIVYKKIPIGNQVWMAENLKYLPAVTDINAETDKNPGYYIYGYEGTELSEAKTKANYTIYGVLYNWYAAMTACPDGWHLPTDEDWKELEIYLGMTQEMANTTGFRGTNQGSKLAGNSSLWERDAVTLDEAFETTRFGAIPGGGFYPPVFEDMNGFNNIGYIGTWWTSSETEEFEAWRRGIIYEDAGIYRNSVLKSQGRSVRCIKNR